MCLLNQATKSPQWFDDVQHGLAPARGHQHQRILSRQRTLDGGLLLATESIVAEDVFEDVKGGRGHCGEDSRLVSDIQKRGRTDFPGGYPGLLGPNYHQWLWPPRVVHSTRFGFSLYSIDAALRAFSSGVVHGL